jgi:hypothetical protein
MTESEEFFDVAVNLISAISVPPATDNRKKGRQTPDNERRGLNLLPP